MLIDMRSTMTLLRQAGSGAEPVTPHGERAFHTAWASCTHALFQMEKLVGGTSWVGFLVVDRTLGNK